MAVFASQLVLTVVAVVLSRLNMGTRAVAVMVMGAAGLNAAIVVLMLMGLRRERSLVPVFVIVVLVVVAGLLGWPAWDIYERARTF
jgi:hypothetical protein